MVSVCLYFQVHQPYRLKKYTVFDIGKNHKYLDDKKNKEIFNKVANKCYLPANKTILNLIKQHGDSFKASYSMSGVFLEQAEEYNPNVLNSFQELVDTGCVEILDETYHHSLAFLKSKEEFKEQVLMHRRRVKQLFNVKPEVFRNTELIYNNEIANYVESMGYKGILAEGADHILGWRSPNFLYQPKTTSKIKLLLKNYRLSDDIAFRFSNKGWKDWPLTASKFAQWVSNINGNGNVANLFMDYETIGEHQWEDTGIFEFLKHLPGEILNNSSNEFKTPSEVIKTYEPVAELDIHHLISWADIERDLSAWLGNPMQSAAFNEVYNLEQDIKSSGDKQLLEDWRKLQTSDHFYYMCTKWFADGDVHKYFNPYENPYDPVITYMNILNDILTRLKKKETPNNMQNTIKESPLEGVK